VSLASGYYKVDPRHWRLWEFDIQPLTEFYAISKDRKTRYVINNSYHRHKADVHEPEYVPPRGWSKIYGYKCGKEFFKQESFFGSRLPIPNIPTYSKEQI
jgi:hypothetical protein